MDEMERRAIAALHWPGWLEIGEPDLSARIAERGAGYDVAGAGGQVDEWDWQRRVPQRRLDGSVRIFEYEPDGWIAALATEPQ